MPAWMAGYAQPAGVLAGDPWLTFDGMIYVSEAGGLADGAGWPLPEVTQDIKGSPRDPTSPDIGHWEIGVAGTVPVLPVVEGNASMDDAGVIWPLSTLEDVGVTPPTTPRGLRQR